jgi:hypothetical protein
MSNIVDVSLKKIPTLSVCDVRAVHRLKLKAADKFLGTSSTYQKQEEMTISPCVRKHFICELWLEECMLVPRHILAVLCEMFSITPAMTGVYVEEDHCMASTLHAKFESSGFLPVGTPRHPCVRSS